MYSNTNDKISTSLIVDNDLEQIRSKNGHNYSLDQSQTYQLTIIVPTKNEVGNVGLLLNRISLAVAGICTEVIFVDDSSDNTPEVIISQGDLIPHLHVGLIHRSPEKRTGGLGGAVVAGMRSARSPWACVMDGDLQHPPELIPVLLEKGKQNHSDLVAASRRNIGSDDKQLGVMRTMISHGLDRIARVLFSSSLKGVKDPLTGFFLVRLKALDLDRLNPKGFKILLEILIKHPKLRKIEIPFQFGSRYSGKSKASIMEALKYFELLLTLRFGENLIRFIGFGLVGISGIGVNTLAMAFATSFLRIHYLISAAIATVFSSTWNFLLTEFLVFNGVSDKAGRKKRFVLFFGMNNLALLFRTPLIYVLTATLGIYYLVSNLISLTLLMVARFVLSDRWIWARTAVRKQKVEGQKPLLSMPTQNTLSIPVRRHSMYNQNYYNLHDILSVSSDVPLPELEPFSTTDIINHPDVIVHIGKPSARNIERGKRTDPKTRRLFYKEIFGPLGFAAEIHINSHVEILASPILKYSPHVLYTNLVEPILRWSFVEKGYALVHGATIAFGNNAYMITARTDTGKTTTLLKILNKQRRTTDQAAFISDDMTLVSPEGIVLSYPKPLTISHHTVRAVNPEVLSFKERLALLIQSRVHSKSGRRLAFFLGKSSLPMATINAFVQWLIPPPKYPVERLVPKVKFAYEDKLAGLFIIERGEDMSESIENKEAIDILLTNCEDAYGFPPYNSIKEFLFNVNGKDLRKIEQSIIRTAMQNLPATLIRSRDLAWWQRIPAMVDQELAFFFSDQAELNPNLRVSVEHI